MMNDFAKASLIMIVVLISISIISISVFGSVWWTGTPDFVLNETADFVAGQNTNTSNYLTRYNQSQDTLEIDFPYAEKDDNLVAYWRFSYDSLTAIDLVNGLDGTALSGANAPTFTASGKFDGAFTYDGGDSFTVDNNALLNFGTTQDFSFSAWIKTAVSNDHAFTSGRGGGGDAWWSVRTYLNKIRLVFDDGSTNVNLDGDVTVTDNAWHHIVGTYDRSGYMKLYVDSTSDGQSDISGQGDIDSGEVYYIGKRSADWWVGTLDEFKVYNRTLSQDEVTELYNSGNRYVDTEVVGIKADWISDTITIPASRNLKNFTVNLTNTDASTCIDWTYVKHDSTSITNTTDICSDGLITFTTDTMAGDFSDITGDFNITLGLTTDGVKTPIIYDVIGYYEDGAPVVADYTSLYAVEFPVDDITFSTSDWTEVFAEEFNTTTAEAFGIMSSFNVMKTTGAGTSILSGRYVIDGEVYSPEVIRTVSNMRQAGSTGMLPLGTSLSGGSHNISFEVSRSGNGAMYLYNFDFVMGKFNSTDGHLVRGQTTNISYSYNSLDWINGGNYTVQKTIDSPTYYGGKLSVTSTGHDHIWLNITNNNTHETSPIMSRHISSATSVGSIGSTWLNTNESGTHNITIGSKNEFGETITVTGAIFDFDLKDSDGDIINNIETCNSSISEETPMLITGADYQLIDSELIRMRNGTGLFISTTLSFNSTTGSQTPAFKINVSNSTCLESNKDRYLADNDDIGNAYMYIICDGTLTVEQNYTVNLWGASEVGETLQVFSTELNAMEVTEFNLTALGTAPAVIIEEPDGTEFGSPTWFNVSTNQDNIDMCWYHIDGNLTDTYYMTNSTGNWWNTTELTEEGIHYVHVHCNNTDGLESSTDDYYFSWYNDFIANLINARHNDLYDVNETKLIEIQHIWYNEDSTFGGYLNTSLCTLELTRPDGSEYTHLDLVNHSDSIYNYTINFTGEPEGTWIAGYVCYFNDTLNTALVDPINVTSNLYVDNYTLSGIVEESNNYLNILLGSIFIFIGIVFIYNNYRKKTEKKLNLQFTNYDVRGEEENAD